MQRGYELVPRRGGGIGIWIASRVGAKENGNVVVITLGVVPDSTDDLVAKFTCS